MRPIKPIKVPKDPRGKIYRDFGDLLPIPDQEPDWVFRRVEYCKKWICNGEEVCPGKPVIVSDIEKSCWCAEIEVRVEKPKYLPQLK